MADNLQRLTLCSAVGAVKDPADHELIARVQKGDAAAFEKRMRRYNPRVFRAARSVLRDDAEAEDVVQETFVRAFHHLQDFQGRSTIARWLTRIAINEALSRLRRAQLFGSLESETSPQEGGCYSVESNQAGPEDQASSRELRSVLIAAIDSLSKDLRTVFVLREVEGLSSLEASEILQLSSETVRVRLHRARQALRRPGAEASGRGSTGVVHVCGDAMRQNGQAGIS